MDIGRSIQYVFQDPDWIKKVLIGGLLFFIPIVGWLIILGYYLRNVQNVMNARDLPLPEWGDWGGDLGRGFKYFVVIFVWSIPAWLLSCISFMIDGFGNTSAVGILFSCLGTLVSLAVAFVTPLFVSRLAAHEELSHAFQFGDIFQEAQRVPSQLLIYVVLSIAIAFVANFGVILCLIGVVFTWFIALMITGHLVGQIRRMLDADAPAAAPATPV